MSTGQSGDVLICGGDRVISLIEMLKAPVVQSAPEIQVCGPELPDSEQIPGDTEVIHDDPTHSDTIARQVPGRPDLAIVLSDVFESDSPDADTLLIALAIEEVNEEIHTIVELENTDNADHFDRTNVNETICADSLTEKLIAQSARNHFMSHFYEELLFYQEEGNEIYRIPGPEEEKPFQKLFQEFLKKQMTVIGYSREGKTILNPDPREHIREGDDLWVLAQEQPDCP